MLLNIFNPEHDLALAANMPTFTPPHAARQLRYDLSCIASLWADKGSAVLTEDEEKTRREYAKIRSSLSNIGIITHEDISFVKPLKLAEYQINEVNLWGWDVAIANQLRTNGINENAIPGEQQLQHIRELSHRKTAVDFLPILRDIKTTVGKSYICNSLNEVEQLLKHYNAIVIKAPWSSSGRGLRFGFETLTGHQNGWVSNVIKNQGSVIVEPYFKKVKDFGMEFNCNKDGSITYCGLSLFGTHNGAYTGNLLATEHKKREILSKYIDLQTLSEVEKSICIHLSDFIKGYTGPIGIDMMALHNGTIHPCVEINLRRTMGHVALNISPDDDDIVRVMRIEMINNTYKLKIRQL